jgi:hypothetical protein
MSIALLVIALDPPRARRIADVPQIASPPLTLLVLVFGRLR